MPLESVGVLGAIASYRVSFTCISDDGTALQGSLTDAASGQNSASLLILLPKADWQAHQADVQKSIKNFAITNG